MKRRAFLTFTIGGVASTVSPALVHAARETDPWDVEFEVTKSDDEWRALLGDNSFLIMREGMTEREYVSVLTDEYSPGTYVCRGCELPLYSSEAKYDSKTGWPSFYEALPGATLTRDVSLGFGFKEQEACRRCGGHLGHIFDDGPPPTGLRHCINGLALRFHPAKPENAG